MQKHMEGLLPQASVSSMEISLIQFINVTDIGIGIVYFSHYVTSYCVLKSKLDFETIHFY